MVTVTDVQIVHKRMQQTQLELKLFSNYSIRIASLYSAMPPSLFISYLKRPLDHIEEYVHIVIIYSGYFFMINKFV